MGVFFPFYWLHLIFCFHLLLFTLWKIKYNIVTDYQSILFAQKIIIYGTNNSLGTDFSCAAESNHKANRTLSFGGLNMVTTAMKMYCRYNRVPRRQNNSVHLLAFRICSLFNGQNYTDRLSVDAVPWQYWQTWLMVPM